MVRFAQFLIALALAIVLIMYMNDVKADGDVTVHCFTQEQLAEADTRIERLIGQAYDYGHDAGMLTTFETVRDTIRQFCADPANAGEPVSFGQGVYLVCPEVEQK